MKRLLIASIALLAGLLASFSARAQSGKTADEFHGHWYIGVQGGEYRAASDRQSEKPRSGT